MVSACIFPQYFEQVAELLWKLLNVCGVNDVMQTEVNTAEPLIPEPSFIGLRIAVGKLHTYK